MTSAAEEKENGEKNFNPHSREGSDYCGRREGKSRSNFNPHSREGSDYEGACGVDIPLTDFNPHSREGSDPVCYVFIKSVSISIHTPARGVTAGGFCRQKGGLYFNPHSREGSDCLNVT